MSASTCVLPDRHPVPLVPLFYEEIEAALAKAFESRWKPSMFEHPAFRLLGRRRHGRKSRRARQDIRETLHRHQQLIVSTYFAECGQLRRP